VPTRISPNSLLSQGIPHHRLREPQLLHQLISADGGAFLERLVEVITDKGAGGARVGAWSEGQKKERGIESYTRRMISEPENARGSRNSTTWLRTEFHPPRAFNSCTQPRMRSCTSSGPTSVRCQASVHLGFAGPGSTAAGLACLLAALESLLRKTRLKKGIFGFATPL